MGVKIKVRPCSKCGRMTLQYREKRQVVHTPDGEVIDVCECYLDCWVCPCCGTMTLDRKKTVESTVVVLPGYPPKEEKPRA